MHLIVSLILTLTLLVSGPAAAFAQDSQAPQAAETSNPTTATPAENTCQSITNALSASWSAYKLTYMQADGRVRDPNADDISTSESQAYAMLRAVWMADQPTFDRVYGWAVDNLITPNQTRLPAWKWGKDDNGDWKILDPASASDADEDMALALLMAAEAFNEPRYHADALTLIDAIWEHEVLKTPYGDTLTPGDWVKRYNHAQTQGHITLNPSYFSPANYRIFAQVDPKSRAGHRWDNVIDSSYQLLDALKNRTRTGLPPNWFQLNLSQKRKPAAIQLYTNPKDQRSDYGYDAIRIHWRIGLDYLLTGDDRAEDILRHTNFLERYWHVRGILPSPLTIDGIERNLDEILYASNSIYGATLPHLSAQYPHIARTILEQFILNKLDNGVWQPATDYYAQNWLWLGLLGYRAHTCPRSGSLKPTSEITTQTLLQLSPFYRP